MARPATGTQASESTLENLFMVFSLEVFFAINHGIAHMSSQAVLD
ncbi:hypothetical protein ARZXY2_109 [Arthrobacter sp. ZXY-2]|nr:hypothetical protein ARZXY2_109 [Arthrobacter sp. ZXY-2]